MSSLIKGALTGADAVREMTAGEPHKRSAHAEAMFAKMTAINGHGPNRSLVEGGPILHGAEADRIEALPTVADVENDGDRGPRASRDPLASIDAAADAQRAAHVGALLAAVAGLHVDEVRVLAAMARQLPGVRLRAACEAATAQGWVRSGARGVEVPSSPLARAQSSLLGTWREWIALILGARSPAAGEVAQRDRGDVLADELARRVAGEPGGEK